MGYGKIQAIDNALACDRSIRSDDLHGLGRDADLFGG
jgi:hypothetical protein